MAIYRPQGRRWTLVAAVGVAGLAVGLLVGWGLLRPPPDPAAAIGDLRTTLIQAAGSLEIVEIEYAEAVQDGEIVARAEYEGARDALASSSERYAEVREAVAAISEDVAAEIDEAYEELERLVGAPAPAEEVVARSEALRDSLTGVLGG